MPYYNLGNRQRIADTRLGLRVDADATALPNNTNTPLFYIYGGRVLMTAIIGECTVDVHAAITTKLQCFPTVTTAGDTDLCSGTDIAACAVGDILSITGTPADALLVSHKGAAQIGKPVVLPIGTLDVDTNANEAGTFKWSLFYVPLDDGAWVQAATISTSTDIHYDEMSRQRLRDMVLGCRVDQVATSIPDTGYDALFNINAGKVLVTAIIGECTEALSDTCQIKVSHVSGTAITTDLCADTDLDTCDVGDLLSITGTPADDILAAHKGAVQIGYPVAMITGTLGITTDATILTGEFKWSCFYVPIDVGATVTAT